MTHYGSGNQAVSEKIRDIRGTSVSGADNTKLGEVDDVIFDHETMEIRYLVVHSADGLEPSTFLLPADHISADEKHEDNLVASVTRQQIENSPRYDKKSLRTEDAWKKYEQDFKKYWDEEPVMHLKGSDRIITMPGESVPVQASSTNRSSQASDRELNAADLFPNRISPVFSDTAPNSGEVTLRPKSVARAEEAATGVTLLKPEWWESFENYLRVNKDDIQAKCPQCAKAA